VSWNALREIKKYSRPSLKIIRAYNSSICHPVRILRMWFELVYAWFLACLYEESPGDPWVAVVALAS
jgi:hypothetical protein